MTRDEYVAKWNSFSWEISEAVSSYYALLGVTEWQDAFLAQVKAGLPVRSSPHVEAVVTISNAVLTHFFIAVCRVRETSNTQLSLPVLVREVASVMSLDSAKTAEMQTLIDKTKTPFEKIKKVRGMTVAHLHDSGSPFAVMKNEGVTREMVGSYLEDCVALYVLLGKLIGHDFHGDISRDASSKAGMSAALHQLSPIK